MVTDLFLDCDTTDEDPSPGYEGSLKDTGESTSDVTEGHGESDSKESEHLYLETKGKEIKKSSDYIKPTLLGNDGGKPLNCREGGQGLSLYGKLKTHTGEKLFICQECRAGFSQSSDLKKHMLTHTGTSANMVHTNGPLNP